jgi:threonine 3-dehydrogenase
MKALVKSKAEQGLWLEEIPEPAMGINDVLVRVQKTGICGTDVHIYQWDEWAQKTIPVPMAMGHEFVGEIVAVGSNVNDFFPGDIVSGEGHVVCGRCRNCLAGRRHLCASAQGVGVNRAGAFAELISLPMTNIWRHHHGIDREVAAIFDPFGNAVHTALSFPVLGEDVLITGAGPIGLMAIPVVRYAGARHVVVTDLNPFRLELARKMGATLAVNSSETPLGTVQKQLGMLEGFDVGLEMSGSPRGAARDDCQHVPRRKDRHSGYSGQGDAAGLPAGDLQYADHQGHLRAGDVRDLVQDVGDAGVGREYLSGDHASLRLQRFRAGLRGHDLRAGRQGGAGLDEPALRLSRRAGAGKGSYVRQGAKFLAGGSPG